MASTEWWQRGPVEGVPAVLQPLAQRAPVTPGDGADLQSLLVAIDRLGYTPAELLLVHPERRSASARYRRDCPWRYDAADR